MFKLKSCLISTLWVAGLLVFASSAFAAPNLDYSSFLGGSGDDFSTAVARDSSGRIFVGGYTNSMDFPGLAANAFQPMLNGDEHRCFVSGLSSDGSKLDFAAILPAPTFGPDNYIVGTGWSYYPLDNGDCRITAMISDDSTASLYVAGVTTMINNGDDNHAASVGDGTILSFVQKFKVRSASDAGGAGLTLSWSRIFGDVPPPPLPPSITTIAAIKLTPGGDPVFTGSTNSGYYPIVSGPLVGGGAYQATLTGERSGVVTVLDAATGKEKHSTYLGVQDGSDHTSIVNLSSLAVDHSGNIIVGGSINHLDSLMQLGYGPGAFSYPVTNNAYLPSQISTLLSLFGWVGFRDAVMTKLSPELSLVEYSLVDSGAGRCDATQPMRMYFTKGVDVAVDGNDNMYMAMLTTAYCMYTTDNAVQKAASGIQDAVVLKVRSDGWGPVAGAGAAFLYQGYVGFGKDSTVNGCRLAVAQSLSASAPDNVYLGCSVVGARRNELTNLVLNRIAREETSTDDHNPVFPGENLFFVRLETSEKSSKIAYTLGMGGTYANNVGGMLLDDANTTLYFTGATLSADYPTAASTAPLSATGSSNSDAIVGWLSTTP